MNKTEELTIGDRVSPRYGDWAGKIGTVRKQQDGVAAVGVKFKGDRAIYFFEPSDLLVQEKLPAHEAVPEPIRKPKTHMVQPSRPTKTGDPFVGYEPITLYHTAGNRDNIKDARYLAEIDPNFYATVRAYLQMPTHLGGCGGRWDYPAGLIGPNGTRYGWKYRRGWVASIPEKSVEYFTAHANSPEECWVEVAPTAPWEYAKLIGYVGHLLEVNGVIAHVEFPEPAPTNAMPRFIPHPRSVLANSIVWALPVQDLWIWTPPDTSQAVAASARTHNQERHEERVEQFAREDYVPRKPSATFQVPAWPTLEDKQAAEVERILKEQADIANDAQRLVVTELATMDDVAKEGKRNEEAWTHDLYQVLAQMQEIREEFAAVLRESEMRIRAEFHGEIEVLQEETKTIREELAAHGRECAQLLRREMEERLAEVIRTERAFIKRYIHEETTNRFKLWRAAQLIKPAPEPDESGWDTSQDRIDEFQEILDKMKEKAERTASSHARNALNYHRNELQAWFQRTVPARNAPTDENKAPVGDVTPGKANWATGGEADAIGAENDR